MCWHTCNVSIWEVEAAKIRVCSVSLRSVWLPGDLDLKMQPNITKAKIRELEKTTDRQRWYKEDSTEIYGEH